MRIAITVLALVVALGGCSSAKKVYSANGTTVTTDSNEKTVTVQSSGATVKVGNSAVDVASLGVPIYAGATQDEGAISFQGAKGSAQMASFSTPDSFDKVYEFYKSKLPAGSEKMKLDEGDSSVAEFLLGKSGGMQTTVMISRKDDKTSIIVSKGSGE